MTTEQGSQQTPGNNGDDKQAWERSVLERLAFASLDEQKKTRRWGIAFKLFFVVYLLVLLVIAIPGDPKEAAAHGEFTALVDLEGVIAPDTPASADSVVHGLRQAFESNAKAVILRTNSPGGSPVQASYINSEINRLREKYPKKAFYAVIQDVCASGCYYAVAGADRIYADPGSLVGSIGVLMDGFGFVGAMNKLGIERRLMTAGENKAIMDPFSPQNKKHKQHVQTMLNEIHQQFIDVVKEGRGKSLKPNREIFSGLFWTGERAMDLGLIDEFGSAGFVAREVVGAEEIVDYTYRETWFDRFAQRLGTAIGNTVYSSLIKGGTLR